MKQENIVRISNEKGNIIVLCESTVPLGEMHDFLLKLKGNTVARMSEAQAEEQAVTDKINEQEVEEIKE